MSKSLYGGIEGGGTKFVCAVASDPGNIVSETRLATTTPSETLDSVCEFFLPYVRAKQIEAIGLGSFGPVDIDPGSPMYGYITTTPKPNWSDTNILGYLQERLGLPVVMNSDVAAAAMGEFQWGASKGCDPSLYLTIGTGIGGGYIQYGKPLRGLVSPEMGHVRIPHDRQVDPFAGICPYHGDCFEGLASGPAIQARMGKRPENLPPEDPFWEIEADYIAYALINFILTCAPRKIVLGGGVMQQRFLYASIRATVEKLLNRYLQNEVLLNRLDEYIVPPMLGNRSGVFGAIALAINFLTS